MGASKYLIVGFVIGLAVGAFAFYSFSQFSQLSSLQTQIDQLKSENAQLKANQPSPTPIPSTNGFTTAQTGKAIQIQSVNYDNTANTFAIYVQNVGDSPVQFAATNSIFINGQAVSGAFTPNTLTAGDTATSSVINTGLNAGLQS